MVRAVLGDSRHPPAPVQRPGYGRPCPRLGCALPGPIRSRGLAVPPVPDSRIGGLLLATPVCALPPCLSVPMHLGVGPLPNEAGPHSGLTRRGTSTPMDYQTTLKPRKLSMTGYSQISATGPRRPATITNQSQSDLHPQGHITMPNSQRAITQHPRGPPSGHT
jgi:hypothetical protein